MNCWNLPWWLLRLEAILVAINIEAAVDVAACLADWLVWLVLVVVVPEDDLLLLLLWLMLSDFI